MSSPTTSTTRVSSEHRREQILDVAMQLFARQGFRGTTTRQIAQEAQVNEAIIFRHFPTKDDLYSAIIQRKIQLAARRKDLRDRLREDRSAFDIFASIAEDILLRTQEDKNVTRLLLFSALEHHELSEKFFRSFIANRFEAMADFIREKIAEGVFRPVDPVLAARGFFGMVVYHIFTSELFLRQELKPAEVRKISETAADLWLRGMCSESGASIVHSHNGMRHRNGKNGSTRQHSNGSDTQ
jgi:AcrR family transcriptional regulator